MIVFCSVLGDRVWRLSLLGPPLVLDFLFILGGGWRWVGITASVKSIDTLG